MVCVLVLSMRSRGMRCGEYEGDWRLITTEADSMRALRFRMSQADKATWAEMGFHMHRGMIPGGGAGVCSSFWWGVAGRRNRLTLFMGGRAGILVLLGIAQNKGVSLKLFRANQIRTVRKICAKNGGEDMEYLLLQRTWKFTRMTMQVKRK